MCKAYVWITSFAPTSMRYCVEMKKQHTTLMITKRAHEALKKRAAADRRSLVATLDLILGV